MALRENNISNSVVLAEDGEQALKILFELTDDKNTYPALVLLDLKLPKVDGIEVLQKIRADPKTAMLPVVIMTSSREDFDINKGYSGGANSYIVKPVDFEQFAEAIRQLGLYWLILNQPPY